MKTNPQIKTPPAVKWDGLKIVAKDSYMVFFFAVNGKHAHYIFLRFKINFPLFTCLEFTAEKCITYVFTWMKRRKTLQWYRAFNRYNLQHWLAISPKTHQGALEAWSTTTTTTAVCKNSAANNWTEAPLTAVKVMEVIIPWATVAHMSRFKANTTSWKTLH